MSRLKKQAGNFTEVEQQVKQIISSIDSLISSNSGAYTDLLLAAEYILKAYDPNEYIGKENLKNKIIEIINKTL